MRVLVLGATGLIGSAVAARLASRGDRVTAVSRSGRDLGLIPVKSARVDLAKATQADWRPHLEGIDAVVNCAGVLQDSPADSTAAVHGSGIAALYAACESAGVRKIIHLSAAGVDRDTPSAFSRTKRQGEQDLMQRDLDWIILRPSVVIGRGAYGASALIRGLASLPLLPVMPATGPIQAVSLDDVVAAILFFLKPDAPKRQAFDLVGPTQRSFDDIVRLVRRWLGWQPAKTIRIPASVASFTYRLGDWLAWLGWRPPVRSTARWEIIRGAIGDSHPLMHAGLQPRDISVALADEPSSVQERWFAGLYILKPLIFIVLSLFWLMTGGIALGPGWDYGMGLMREGGVGERMAALTVIAGALADILIGLCIAYRPVTRIGLVAAIGLALVYAVIGTVLVPRLWADPLGPMLKIWPVIVLHLAALAILEDR